VSREEPAHLRAFGPGIQAARQSFHDFVKDTGPAMSKRKKMCPKCDEMELTRVARRGFLQEYILPRFGMYPWECGQCRRVFLLSFRGRHERRPPVSDSMV
jgi:ribosomal protein L37AE/L43A